jgi:hypothetical protein
MEKIFNIINSLIEKLGIKPKWLHVFILILVFVIAFFVDEALTNNYYYKNIESQVSILSKLNEIDYTKISKNPDLYPSYKRISQELTSANNNLGILSTLLQIKISSVLILKVLTAGLVWIILIILSLFKTLDRVERQKAVSLYIKILLFFCVIGAITPIIFSPLVNYIMFPLLQSIFLIWAYRRN